MEPSNLSLETPRATIPDLYVGFSPSFSTHFLTSSNIALPYSQDSSPFSPTLQYRPSLFDYYKNSTPVLPGSPLATHVSQKTFPNSKKRFTTSERSAVPSQRRHAPPASPARPSATWIRSPPPTLLSTVSSRLRCDCSTD